VIKINFIIRLNRKVKLWSQKGQSTLEYALVVVIAGIISAILLAVGKPIIIDTISKVFNKIASMV
jgi:Flp pilus assembly pilin Flp